MGGTTPANAPAIGAAAEKAPANGAAIPNAGNAPATGATTEKTSAIGEATQSAGATTEKTPATGAVAPSTGGAATVMAFHKVEVGENWEAIAKKYSVTVEELLTFNDAKDKKSGLPAAGSPIRLSKAPSVV